MKLMTTRLAAHEVRGWYTRRGITVAEDLVLLQGPTTGAFVLPPRIEASHRKPYDLGDAHQRSEAYRVVLMEALRQDDLASWLDRDELVRVWPDLYLPRDIRAAWQVRHPVLAARGAGPHVPQP